MNSPTDAAPPPFPEDLPPLPPRPVDAHKGSMGRVLIVGGSRGMAGAVILAARAALRSGAGLVTAALPSSLVATFDGACLEAMSISLPEDPEGSATAAGLRTLAPHLDRTDALVIGPGFGRAETTEALFRAVIDRYNGPHVIDADGAWFLARAPETLAAGSDTRVLTPHDGEFARLLDGLGSQHAALTHRHDRERSTTAFAAAVPGVLVRKGPRTRIACGDEIAINETGNPGLATGGTGDVLAGVIGGLLARGDRPWVAARRAVWLHGRAGDRARDRLGEESLIASDAIEELPGAFLEMAAALATRR